MNIQPNIHYCTRSGRRARIYATDAGGRFPIHGAIQDEIGWFMVDWTDEGRKFPLSEPEFDSDDDLVALWEESK